MKFAAFALVAFASTAYGIPPNFVEQCCGDFVKGVAPFNFPPGRTVASWMETSALRISGYNAPECLSPTGAVMSDQCITIYELCEKWSYGKKDGSETLGAVKPGSNGLLCCPIQEPDCGGNVSPQPLDTPWTCATKIGWSAPLGMPEKDGPDASSRGLYCGRTDVCKDFGIICGDPHFQTWSGDWYDFHGECDLKFLENKEFGEGLGMEIQVRTKARYEYSYVEAAAIRIGDDVLEVSAYGQYMFNGVESADLKHTKFADQFEIEHEIRDSQHHIFTVYTGVDLAGRSEAIQIKTFKDLVAVKMQSAFARTFAMSQGMMGDFREGKMLARDGQTLIEDPIEFGMEWQVKSDETSLFQTPSPVTGKCIMPSANASAERRRLGETVPLEAAVAACEAVDHVHHENCVYDVMATGDLEIAHAGVF